MNSLLQRFAGLSKVLTAFVVLGLILAAAIVFTHRDGKKYVTIDFRSTNSVYKGSDVRILGVPVGKVESLTPKGDYVRVKISYDAKYKVPASAKAVVVSPSIVGDRFVQLAPAYSGGAVMADNATIPVSRTAVPVELDKVYSSLNDLSTALGPKGANKNGSVSQLVKDSATQLDGQGAQLNTTIKNFGKLSQTLSDNKDNLFGSVTQVEQFVKLLKDNDSTVRSFNDSTAQVSQVLADERGDLAKTLKALGYALIDVRDLVKDNRSVLKGDVDDLTSISKVLAKNQSAIEDIVVDAPTALSNVALTYNGSFGTLDNRADLGDLLTFNLQDPSLLLCSLLGESGTQPGEVCTTIKNLLGGLTSALPRTAAGSSTTTSKTPTATTTSESPDKVDSSLAQMLGGK